MAEKDVRKSELVVEKEAEEKHSPQLRDESRHYERKSERVREAILDDKDVPEVPVTNAEVQNADQFVGSEKTTSAERGRNVSAASGGNRTHTGLASDLHQVLVGATNHYGVHAASYEEIDAAIRKYRGEEENPDREILSLLEEFRAELEPKAKLHARAKVLLEKHV